MILQYLVFTNMLRDFICCVSNTRNRKKTGAQVRRFLSQPNNSSLSFTEHAPQSRMWMNIDIYVKIVFLEHKKHADAIYFFVFKDI